MDSIRTFIAIPTPTQVRETLREIVAVLQTSGAEVKWEPADKLHITLKFFGDIGTNILPDVLEKYTAACGNLKSFSLVYGGLGCFPNSREPRIIWAGSKNDDGLLDQLKKTVDELGIPFGFEPEKRSFQPHITIGRVKGKRNIPGLIKMLQSVTFEPQSFLIDEIYFMKSELRPAGSIYNRMQSIMLKK